MIVAALSLLAAQIPTKPFYRTYTNVRFTYAVDVPTFLTAGPEPANGDGRAFTAKRPEVRLVVYGGLILANSSRAFLKNAYATRRHEAREAGRPPTLAVLRSDFFALSWRRADRIVYTKVIALPEKAYAAVEIEYPQTKRAEMDRVVTRIAGSLRAVHR